VETNHTDHDLLVITAERVFWIKETLEKTQATVSATLKEHRKEIDGLKKQIYYMFGGLAAVLGLAEFLAHAKEFLKL
jgi:hypothetical protein